MWLITGSNSSELKPLFLTLLSSSNQLFIPSKLPTLFGQLLEAHRSRFQWRPSKHRWFLGVSVRKSCVATGPRTRRGSVYSLQAAPYVRKTSLTSRCPALQPTRVRMMKYTNEYSRKNPIIKPLLLCLCVQSSPTFCQFLLDCSPLPEVISAVHLHGSQIHDHLFQITRTWIYTLHKVRMKLLGRWRNFKWIWRRQPAIIRSDLRGVCLLVWILGYYLHPHTGTD